MAKEKWQEMMDFLTINKTNYTDKQWAERFELDGKEIPANAEVTHAGCNKIITTRVIAYCKEKGIEM